MKRLWILLVLTLAACASVPDTAEEAALREQPRQPRMHAELVRGMISNGQLHAALAHIEELERLGDSNPDELLWLRARVLYALDQIPEASVAYTTLLKTSYAAQAHHGLGLLAARTNLKAAVRHFNQAVKLSPTDAEVRNDLGYTLLQAGRVTEARHHLATAAELAPEMRRAKSNLVLSFLVEGRDQEAGKLARSLEIAPEPFRQLQAESRLIKSLIAQRASEFVIEAPQEESKDDVEQSGRDDRPLPGLYRSVR